MRARPLLAALLVGCGASAADLDAPENTLLGL
jgi:hypothetical protein